MGYCVTYLWSTTETPNRVFTIFNCEDKVWEGVSILDAEPRGRATTTSGSTPSTQSTQPPTTTPAAATAAPEGSSPPVGAIVGGVIGGLAVIGAVVLGVVYIIFRNRKASRGTYEPAAKTEPETPHDSGRDSMLFGKPAPPYPSYDDLTPPQPPSSIFPGSTLGYPQHQTVSSEVVLIKSTGTPSEAATSPLSKEMPTSPASKEMESEGMTTIPLVPELSSVRNTAELAG